MSSRFECVVIIDGKKHTISIGSDDTNEMPFGDIYHEMIRVVTSRPAISYETHVFECFDFDTNAFKRIQSFNQYIRYLSRIRVSAKSPPQPSSASHSAEHSVNKMQTEDYYSGQQYKRGSDQWLSGRNFPPLMNSTFKSPIGSADSRPPQQSFRKQEAPPMSRQPSSIPSNSSSVTRLSQQSFIKEMTQYMMDTADANTSHNSSQYSNSMDFTPSPVVQQPRSAVTPTIRPSVRPFSVQQSQPQQQQQPRPQPQRQPLLQPPVMAPTYGQHTSAPYNRPNTQPTVRPLQYPTARPQQSYRPQVVDYGNNGRNDGNYGYNSRPNQYPEVKTTAPPLVANASNPRQQLENEGLVITDGKAYCQLCKILLPKMDECFQHIVDIGHMRKRSEECYKGIEMRFILQIGVDCDLQRVLNRRHEVLKFNEPQKQALVKHGIALNTGSGLRCYECLSCHESFPDSGVMLAHYRCSEPRDYQTLFANKSCQRRLEQFHQVLDPSIVMALAKEGVECSKKKGSITAFKCFLCFNDRFTRLEEIQNHIQSKTHSDNKVFKGIDRLIATDITTDNTELLMARKKVLHNMHNLTKEKALLHGVRVVNGTGAEAFICTLCNLQFSSIDKVVDHLNQFPELDTLLRTGYPPEIDDWSEDQIQSLFAAEGIIVRKNPKRGLTAKSQHAVQYYCQFCNVGYNYRATVLEHWYAYVHKKVKRMDFIPAVDEVFVTETDRKDEFDVAFARHQVLLQMDSASKNRYSSQGIRLKNGYDYDAFVCLKCKSYIGAESYWTGMAAVHKHVTSEQHIKNL